MLRLQKDSVPSRLTEIVPLDLKIKLDKWTLIYITIKYQDLISDCVNSPLTDIWTANIKSPMLFNDKEFPTTALIYQLN